MACSLWRGTECLGEVVAEVSSDRAVVYGLFRPFPTFTDIGHLMQTRLPIAGRPVVLSRFDGSVGPGPTALRPMAPEEAAGLPREAQLILLDDAGEALDVDVLALHPNHLSDDFLASTGPYADLCRQHGFRETVWLLSAFRH